jgi:plasmid maintenance system antidote protein VapI
MTTFPRIEQTNLALTVAALHGRPMLAADMTDRLSKALGQAMVHCWSRLPRDVQQDLFEAAVASEGEAIRQHLAVFLHGTHARTIGSLQARAMPEPDSLGG